MVSVYLIYRHLHHHHHQHCRHWTWILLLLSPRIIFVFLSFIYSWFRVPWIILVFLYLHYFGFIAHLNWDSIQILGSLECMRNRLKKGVVSEHNSEIKWRKNSLTFYTRSYIPIILSYRFLYCFFTVLFNVMHVTVTNLYICV